MSTSSCPAITICRGCDRQGPAADYSEGYCARCYEEVQWLRSLPPEQQPLSPFAFLFGTGVTKP